MRDPIAIAELLEADAKHLRHYGSHARAELMAMGARALREQQQYIARIDAGTKSILLQAAEQVGQQKVG